MPEDQSKPEPSEKLKWLIFLMVMVIVITSPLTMDALFNIPFEATANIVIKLGGLCALIVGFSLGYKNKGEESE